MECTYKDSIIDLYGDETIIEYIKEETVDDIFDELYSNLFLDKDRKPSKPLYAFENFVIKYYDSIDDTELKSKCDQIIGRLYECLSISNIQNTTILSNASSLFKSTLSRTDYLNKFANEKEKNEVNTTKQILLKYSAEYVKKFNIYFDKKMELIKSGISIYNNKELKQLELADEEKKILLNFFSIQKTNTSNSLKWVEEAQEKYFISLLADPYSSTNNVNEKEFLVMYSIKHFYSDKYDITPEYSFEYIQDKKELGGAIRGTDYITINFSSKLNMSNLNIVQTACHEAEHIAQGKKDYKKDLNDSLPYQYMIRIICGMYPQEYNITENREKDLETDRNYKFMEIEIDAEKIGNFKLKSFISDYLYRKYSLDSSKLDHRIELLNKEIEDRLSPLLAKKELNKQSVPVYHYNMVRMKQIISNHPELIKKFPVLELLYDNDGTIKNVEEIIMGEPLKNQMIVDFILEAIYNDELKKIDITNCTTQQKCNYMKNLSNCLSFELDKIQAFVNNPMLIRKDDTYLLFKANLFEINKLIDELEKNITILDEENLSLESQGKLRMLIDKMHENEEVINEVITPPHAPDNLITAYNFIKNKLGNLNRKLEVDTYNKIFNRRKEYILNNNIDKNNEIIIENIINTLSFDDEFYNYIIQDNLGNNITVKEYIYDFVQYNLINGNVMNFYGEEIPLSAILYTAYQHYCDEKNNIEGSQMSTDIHL